MFRKRTPIERLWEILPGLQLWTVFFGAILLSALRPVWAALFIICFDLYWVLKALNVATHLLAAYKKFKFVVTVDWLDCALRLEDFKKTSALFEGYASSAKTSTGRKFYQSQIDKIK